MQVNAQAVQWITEANTQALQEPIRNNKKC